MTPNAGSLFFSKKQKQMITWGMKAGETFFFDPYLYTACTMLTFTFVQSIYLCNNIRIRSCVSPLLLPSLHPSFSYNSPFRYGIHSSLADFKSVPNSSSPTFFYRSWKIKHYMSYLLQPAVTSSVLVRRQNHKISCYWKGDLALNGAALDSASSVWVLDFTQKRFHNRSPGNLGVCLLKLGTVKQGRA